MEAEGELRSNLEESDRVRELQDKVADLKAEVSSSTDCLSDINKPLWDTKIIHFTIKCNNHQTLTHIK